MRFYTMTYSQRPAVPPELLDFILQGDKFLVAGHKEPDGDCVGSQLALSSLLRRLGKTALPCSAGPFKRTEVAPYGGRFSAAPGEGDRSGARVIVVDCSAPSRTGDLAPFLEGLPRAVIDHHPPGEYTEGGGPVFLDPRAPSVTYMILELTGALGLEPTVEEAELLLFGLCTDTGFFRHVDRDGERVFLAAARMVRAGASPKEAFQAIQGGKSLDSRLLLGALLSRARSYFDGKLLLTTEEYEDTRRFGAEGRDSDNLYRLLQSVAGVEAVVVIRQEKEDRCTLGFRSRDQVDVAALAARFGGGGHRNAAGLSLSGTIREIEPRILAAFGEIFSDIHHTG
jgi:phosphoesterase RecJ-like protein